MPTSPAVLQRPVVELQTIPTDIANTNQAYASRVSWAAVVGGAFVSAAISLILLALGTGFGFTAISPWSNLATTASIIGTTAIAWLIATQIVSSALGGYLAGRLRTKWANVHTDEVYFRDTAHGLLVWALGLVVTAAFLTSAATSLAGDAALRGAGQNAATAGTETPAASSTSVLNPSAYMVDLLFRSSAANDHNDALARGEAQRILAYSMKQGGVSAEDKRYLAQTISAHTGLSQSDAETRVSDVFTRAQQSADNARKAIAHLSLWLFVALLCGAFCSSYFGTVGGRLRDRITT
jgi:hypothetical protein